MTKYQFYNVNPLGALEEDCVTRAITLATKSDYYKVKDKLYLIAQLFECDKLCVCCYKHLLDEVYKLPRIPVDSGTTICDFLKIHNKGTYIIRVDGHLTCGIDGICFDIWNCVQEYIDIVWEVI